MLGAFLFYAIPQGIGELRWGDGPSWGGIYQVDRALLLAPHILLVISSLFFVLSTIALLRKLWVERQVPREEQNWLR